MPEAAGPEPAPTSSVLPQNVSSRFTFWAAAITSLEIHSPEPPETEPPHPVPLLGLGEHRLHPHLALAQSLLVGLGLSVGQYPLQEPSSKLRLTTRPLFPGVHSGFEGQALQAWDCARYLVTLSV